MPPLRQALRMHPLHGALTSAGLDQGALRVQTDATHRGHVRGLRGRRGTRWARHGRVVKRLSRCSL